MTAVARRGEPPGLVGWTADPRPPSPKNLRLYIKCNARGLSQLDLSHRGLTHVPLQVFQFQQLDVLKLSHNHLDILPVMISYLRGLRALHLQHNLLTALPETLVNCRHLGELDLTHNRLTALPKGIASLKQLRILKLGQNQLEQLPHELGALASLRVLDLHGNRLWYIPFSMENLYHLLRLDLSDNMFDQMPLVLTKMPWVRALNLSKNRLAALPPDFDQMRGLRELNLSQNRFVTLGIMATKLRHLKYLSLAHNRLQFLPDQMAHLQELRVLHLQDNCLEVVPDSLPHLKYLNVSRNKLKNFSVLRMRQLVALDGSDNLLETVPQGVYKLKQLRRLALARNRITELAEDVGWLKSLQSLDLSENDLRNLPASLYFMPKLTSFNVRGNHNISRVLIPSVTNVNEDMEKAAGLADKSKVGKHEKAKKDQKNKLLREYSSMPSLHHTASQQQEAPQERAKQNKDSDQPTSALGSCAGAQDPKADVDKSWLDIFRKSQPSRRHRRASWDEHMKLRTAHSIPYPMDMEYGMAEMQATFSAESESDDDKYEMHDPYALMSFPSHGSDSALDASFSSQDDAQTPYPAPHQSGDMNSHVRPTMQSFGSQKTGIHGNSSHNSLHTSQANGTSPSTWDQTEKKVPFTSSTTGTSHAANSTLYASTARPPPSTAATHSAYTGQHTYSKSSTSKTRDMNYLFTNIFDKNNKHHKRKGKSMPGTLKSKTAGTQVSDGNWTLRSHLSEPLTVQTWTQTNPEPENVQTWTQTQQPNVNIHSQSQMSSHINSQPSQPISQSDFHTRSALSTHTGLHSHNGLVSTSCDDFIMKKQPSQTISSFQPSARSSYLHPLHAESGDTGSSINPLSQQSSDLTRGGTVSKGGHTDQATDYTLLGVCNQIQTLLHKDLLQPVIGFNGRQPGRFSNKTVSRSTDAAWLSGQDEEGVKVTGQEVKAGMEYSPAETFTATAQGGHYVSAFCPNIQVSVPPGATEHTVHVTLQQLTIAPAVLHSVAAVDSYVSNIISLGPIVFLNSLEKVSFASPVTLTIPAPARVKGHPGHLVVVSVLPDNTCVPCSTGYQSSRREVTLTTWHMTGKVAVWTKAKCKYKACKSVEQLLMALNIAVSRSTNH